ncbi:MAG: hypothetical protein HYU33_07120 [Candidatus Omnitrophica bacterium]|nr:hypothetical protein [Candidatus Omnitrophota bacterium]
MEPHCEDGRAGLDGGTFMPIFKIWHRGSKEVSIEEGNSVEEACGKAGWKREDCECEAMSEDRVIDLYSEGGAQCQSY